MGDREAEGGLEIGQRKERTADSDRERDRERWK